MLEQVLLVSDVVMVQELHGNKGEMELAFRHWRHRFVYESSFGDANGVGMLVSKGILVLGSGHQRAGGVDVVV